MKNYNVKSTESTEFDGVRKRNLYNGDHHFYISKTVDGLSSSVHEKYDSPREAAIMLDKWLLNHGKEPINILKPLRKR